MYLYITLLITIILDLISKYTSLNYLNPDRINIIGDFIYLKHIINPGIAFSIPLTGIALKVVTILLLIGIFYYYLKEEKQKNNNLIDLSFGMIIGGGIANGYERIFNSGVIDFIGVKYFAIFNLADSFIFIGACLYLYVIFFKEKE